MEAFLFNYVPLIIIGLFILVVYVFYLIGREEKEVKKLIEELKEMYDD